ncbi:MAG TPA: FkbM family methyltransferase, partial [Sphingobium sp.]|nr:FkbM family methyltransferase [Sphingobium sp.]
SYGNVCLAFDGRDRTHLLGVTGRYGVRVSNEVERLQPGDCFIDVGANCGIFTLLAAERVGPDGLVVAFEPCFSTFAKLVRNIGLNAFGNVLPLNMALADLTRPDLLDNSAVGHSGRFSIAHEPVEAAERVMTLAISDFPGLMKLIGDRSITVKIDVEGFEYAVLQGLQPILALPQTSGAVVEVDDHNLGRYGNEASDIFGLLERHGFIRVNPGDGGGHFDAVFRRPNASAPRPAASVTPLPPREPAAAPTAPKRRWSATRFARAAAIMLAIAGGSFVLGKGVPVERVAAEEYFIQEALQSHEVSEMRAALRRSPPTVFNAGEVGSSARIALPVLPHGWRVTDVQLFPSDSGPSLQMTIRDKASRPVSLFAVRDDDVAPAKPAVMTRDGKTVAYWQEGELAYALVAQKRQPAELDRLAEDIADNVTS